MKTLANESDRQEILRRIAAVDQSKKPVWGRMSAAQMICHLRDAKLMYLGEMPVARVRSVAPRPLLKWAALYLPMPWPRGIRTAPELDQLAHPLPPEDFETSRRELVALIERLGNLPSDFAWPEHPMMGRMSPHEWQLLGYRHCDHHLRQFGC